MGRRRNTNKIKRHNKLNSQDRFSFNKEKSGAMSPTFSSTISCYQQRILFYANLGFLLENPRTSYQDLRIFDADRSLPCVLVSL